MGACRSVQCGAPKQVYKIILNEIFKPSFSNTKSPNEISANIENEIPKLRNHVKVNAKGLIDHLEANHNKLVDCGYYLARIIDGNCYVDTYLICLFVLNELLTESKKFRYDSNLLKKMRMNRTLNANIVEEGHAEGVIIIDSAKYTDDIIEDNIHLTENIIQFEEILLDILLQLIENGRSNPSIGRIILQHSIITLQLYGANKFTHYYSEKLEIIFNTVFEFSMEFRNMNNYNDVDIQVNILNAMISFAKIPNFNLILKLKQKYVDHSFKCLIFIYEANKNDENDSKDNIRENIDNNSNNNESLLLVDKIEMMKKMAFDIIGLAILNIIDLNEFNGIITPFMLYFDSIKWNNNPLQIDIFQNLIKSSQKNNAYEQTEVYLIEKIIEYVNYKKDYIKYNNNDYAKLYKNNQDKEIRLKVFQILEQILNDMNNYLLSFLFINQIMECFLNNLDINEPVNSYDLKLKDIIYKCHDKLLSKISGSSKILIQIINKICSIITEKISYHQSNNDINNDSNRLNITNYLEFLQYTLEKNRILPSQVDASTEGILNLIKIRDTHFYNDQGIYTAIETFFSLKYVPEQEYGQIQEMKLDEKNTEYLQINENVIFIFLARTIKEIKEHCLDPSQSNTIKFFNFYNFLKHHGKVIKYLLLRKTIRMFNILIPFFMKILDFIKFDKVSNIHRFGLVGSLIETFLDLNAIWNIDGLTMHISKIYDIFPNKALMDNLVKHCGDIFESLDKFENTTSWIQKLEVNQEAIKKIENLTIQNTLINYFMKISPESFIRFIDNFDHIKDYDIYMTYSNINTHNNGNGSGVGGGESMTNISDHKPIDYSMEKQVAESYVNSNNNNNGSNGIINNKQNGNINNLSLNQILHIKYNEENIILSNGDINSFTQRKSIKQDLNESFEQTLEEIRKNKMKKKILSELIDNKI